MPLAVVDGVRTRRAGQIPGLHADMPIAVKPAPEDVVRGPGSVDADHPRREHVVVAGWVVLIQNATVPSPPRWGLRSVSSADAPGQPINANPYQTTGGEVRRLSVKVPSLPELDPSAGRYRFPHRSRRRR